MARNPFSPGAGRPPPYLAGRAEEQRQLEAEDADMQAAGVDNTVTMYGPRGMGKTVLVSWLEELCERKAVDVVSITAKDALHSVGGWVPRDPASPSNGVQDRVLVVWRKLTGDIGQDNLMLDEWFLANCKDGGSLGPDTVYWEEAE